MPPPYCAAISIFQQFPRAKSPLAKVAVIRDTARSICMSIEQFWDVNRADFPRGEDPSVYVSVFVFICFLFTIEYLAFKYTKFSKYRRGKFSKFEQTNLLIQIGWWSCSDIFICNNQVKGLYSLPTCLCANNTIGKTTLQREWIYLWLCKWQKSNGGDRIFNYNTAGFSFPCSPCRSFVYLLLNSAAAFRLLLWNPQILWKSQINTYLFVLCKI